MIEGILLDLDNTLYDYQKAHEPAITAAIAYLAGVLEKDAGTIEGDYFACRQNINRSLSGLASSHSRLLYFQGVCERYNRLPCESAAMAEDVYWKTFFDHMTLRDGAVHFLATVNKLQIPVCIVTDLTARIQFEKVNKLGLADYVYAIVTSEECGHEKPHPAMFELGAAKLNLAFSSLCMIGDSFERDIEGATALGIKCFWYGEMLESALVQTPRLDSESVVRFSQFAVLTELIEGVGVSG
jgi:HAD superfamily hydrolase (TIGR01549 family)